MMVFETKVTGVGLEAESFKEVKIVILFGEAPPESLAEYCYHIELKNTKCDITAGMNIMFDKQTYQITAVGGVVRSNLERLGHITIQFDGSSAAELPGTLYVEAKQMPKIEKGTIITIA